MTTVHALPTRIATVEGPEDTLILAELYDDGHTGIVVDAADDTEIRRVLAANRKHMPGTWTTYAEERGSNYLLLDIWRLAAAIRTCPKELNLKSLRRVSGAYEMMHSRYQAELMAEAEAVCPGGVGFIEAKKSDPKGDFQIDVERRREFELKTVLATAVVEKRRTGFAIAPDCARGLATELRRRGKQGFQQIDASGTVICVLWCDLIGAAVSRELKDHEVARRDVFDGFRYVIGARDEKGKDRWFGFRSEEQWKRELELLPVNISKRRSNTVNLGIPWLKCFSNRAEWITVGRPVRIDGSKQHEN